MKFSAQTFTIGLTVFLVGLGISGLTHAQSKSSTTTKGDDAWFFLWDYDTLFNDGELIPAEREYPFIQK